MTGRAREWYNKARDAGVAELADALDLGSSAARRGGSSPLVRTNDAKKRQDKTGLVVFLLPAAFRFFGKSSYAFSCFYSRFSEFFHIIFLARWKRETTLIFNVSELLRH